MKKILLPALFLLFSLFPAISVAAQEDASEITPEAATEADSQTEDAFADAGDEAADDALADADDEAADDALADADDEAADSLAEDGAIVIAGDETAVAATEQKPKKPVFLETAPEPTGNKFIDFFNQNQPIHSRHLEGRRVFEFALNLNVAIANGLLGADDILSAKSPYRNGDAFTLDLGALHKKVGKNGTGLSAKFSEIYVGFDLNLPTKRNEETGEIITMGGTGFGLHVTVDGGFDINMPQSFFTLVS